MLVSLIIRTLNEERYLPELLRQVRNQKLDGFEVEVVIVDSGSTDRTLIIASEYQCNITHINKEEFTFGRSLNLGCAFAKGDIFVFISGHCVPTNTSWLKNLLHPIICGLSSYTYGKQMPRDGTKFSEKQLFSKYYPEYSKIPQDSFFVNNANAALSKAAWSKYLFDEALTGLEDMCLAKKLFNTGEKISYCSDASVFHIHHESWRQVRVRYEREALALQKIMPEVHFNIIDLVKFLPLSIYQDAKAAFKSKVLLKEIKEIIIFRSMYYFGTYRGGHIHKKLSQQAKHHYFYPLDVERHKYE